MNVPKVHPLWSRSDIKGFQQKWEDWKKQNHLLDFTDMIEQLIKEIDTAPGDPQVILLDEAQDTGAIEMQLLMKWAKKAQFLALYADPAQALFAWRGTDPLLVQNMRLEHDPDRKILDQSYRLPRKVYEYALSWQRRFRQTLKVEYKPRVDPITKQVVEGSVEQLGTPFSRFTPEFVSRLVEPYLKENKTVMFEATCGYMLEPVLKALREAGLPFGNEWRSNNGRWNPLPQKRAKGFTIVDRVLAFSAPRVDLWGDRAHFWSAEELRAWCGGLAVTGIFQRNAQAAIKGLKDGTDAKTISDAFPSWFVPEMLGRLVPKPDLGWYLGQVKGSDRLRDYVTEIVARYGVGKLAEKPLLTVGTVHSLKGSEADIVIVCPDLSLEAYNAASGDKDIAEELKRVFYTGCTRAKEKLLLCRAGNRLSVEW